MIRLSTRHLKSGMTTAQGIYNSRGASYLTRGTKLNQHYIDKLHQIGINQVDVTSLDPNINIVPPPDILHEQTRVSAIHRVYDTFLAVQNNQGMDISSIMKSAGHIISDLVNKSENLVQITDIRLYDDYTFAHSVNVAALTSMMGLRMDLEGKDLLTLTTGALLHDIGKLDVPVTILNKPSGLSEDEFDTIKRHPSKGWNRLKDMDEAGIDVSVMAEIAYQHHEHMDGQGYPQHIRGDMIHEYSRIVAIADVYDALTSQRPYKRAYAPHIAYKIMSGCSGKQFDNKLMELFFDHVSLYPIGTVLRTSLGCGIVEKVTIGMTRYPFIILFSDARDRLLTTPVHIDTALQEPDFIKNVINGGDLIAMVRMMRFDPACLLELDGPQSDELV